MSDLLSLVEGLINTWDKESPFRRSLVLTIEDWKMKRAYIKEEHPIKNEKDLVNVHKKMARTRISYTTSTCGLPPTNLGGGCRSFEPPKRILAKPYKEEPEATEVADTTSKTSNGKEHVVC